MLLHHAKAARLGITFSSTWLNKNIMGNLLYIIAVILIIGWLLGAFAFNVGGNLIHILLVIAIVAVLLQVIRGRRSI